METYFSLDLFIYMTLNY